MNAVPQLTRGDLAEATACACEAATTWQNLLTEAMALCVSHYRPADVRPPDYWIIEQLTRVGFLLSEINEVGLDAIREAIDRDRERARRAEQSQKQEA